MTDEERATAKRDAGKMALFFKRVWVLWGLAFELVISLQVLGAFFGLLEWTTRLTAGVALILLLREPFRQWQVR